MTNLRGHNCKLVKPISHINCRYHFFVARIVDAWNDLPQTVIDSHNIVQFKNALKTVNQNKYLHVLL